MCFDSSTCAFKTAGQFNFGFSWPGIWPEGGLKLEILFFVNRPGGLGGKGVYLQHRYFEKKIVLYKRKAMTTFLPQTRLHPLCRKQLYIATVCKLKAFISHIIPKKSIYLKKKKKIPELWTTSCRFGVFLVLWKSYVLVFPACNCVQHVLYLLLRKNYIKHYIVTL